MQGIITPRYDLNSVGWLEFWTGHDFVRISTQSCIDDRRAQPEFERRLFRQCVATDAENSSMKRIPLDDLYERARLMTQAELANYVVPDEVRGSTSVTTFFEGDDRVFLLYVPGQSRSDPFVIARTTMSSLTSEGKAEDPSLQRIHR